MFFKIVVSLTYEDLSVTRFFLYTIPNFFQKFQKPYLFKS